VDGQKREERERRQSREKIGAAPEPVNEHRAAARKNEQRRAAEDQPLNGERYARN
jgi:hypothetical protein